MKTIKTIITALLLLVGMTVQAQDKLVVKSGDNNDKFEPVSRIVVDLTQEKPVVRSSEKSIVCTSDFQILMEYENLEDAVNTIEAKDNKKTDIYDLSGRKVQKPNKGVFIKNGKKVLVK